MERNVGANAHQFNFLRMTFKVLVPVSVFSFVISQYSSLILPLLLHSADEFSSSFSVNHLFRYSSERNYVFLLCNGILVFIIKNSGLIAMPPPTSHVSPREIPTPKPTVAELKNTEDERVISIHHHQEEEESKNILHSNRVESTQTKEEESKKIVIFTDHYHQEEEEEKRKMGDAEKVSYSDHHHHQGEEEEDDEDEEEIAVVGGDDEEEGEEEWLSKEELNKKCDEFIKKMRQDIIMKM